MADNGDGTFTFDPGADFQDLAAGETRDVTFEYTATDGNGAVSNIGVVTVTVSGVNDAPVVADVAASAIEDGPAVTGSFIGDDVDSDDDGGSLTYTITALPGEGAVADNGDGTFTFDPGGLPGPRRRRDPRRHVRVHRHRQQRRGVQHGRGDGHRRRRQRRAR